MIWFFIVVTLVAIALGVVRSAEQGQSLTAALVFTALFIGFFSLFSGTCFVIAFVFGVTEKAVAGSRDEPASPFIDGSLPEQIIPPKPVDGNQ